jgi:putative ABC transport system permease protein
MFKNYFLVAFRNFRRNKTFALINILGLAIGISAALVIFLIVDYDFAFDHFEKNRDRIYRVVEEYTSDNGVTSHFQDVCIPMGPVIQKEITGIELTAPFRTWDENPRVIIPRADGKQPAIFKNQQDQIFADARYFELINYTWISGSPATSLNQPYQVVLTESNARKYYPGLSFSDILGKPIVFDDTIHTVITGIVKNIAYNTDFNFGTFVSRSTLETERLKPGCWDQWGCTNSADQLFLRLYPGMTATRLITQLNRVYRAHNPPHANDHNSVAINIQPLNDLHFDTVYSSFDNNRTAHKPTMYGLMAIAAFLLLLACINFINLTTAQATQRAKEIGIRKTMGGKRHQLIFQFLSETFLLTLISTFLSIALTPLLLKAFADFIPSDLHFSFSRQPLVIPFLVLLILIVSLLSGFYPALVMSGYKPISILKNQALSNSGRTRSAWFRKSLTVSQFVIAQVFIIATLLVGKQITFLLNKDLGFKKDAIVFFGVNRNQKLEKRSELLHRLRAIPGITRISMSSDPPSSNGVWTSGMDYKDDKNIIHQEPQVKIGDTNYLLIFGLRLVAGNNITQSDTTNSLLINETLSRNLGFRDPGQAVGKQIDWNGKQRIVGVLTDFHPQSLRNTIGPLVVANGLNQAYTFNLALQPQIAGRASWTTTISKMEQAFKEVYPADDFEYYFMDETVAKFYTAEKNIEHLLYWATGLMIFISCLGLLGLAIYITNQRTKEIGIRKVIGATVTQIVMLISKDFMKLIGLAVLIALPIAWWGSNEWLKNFAYKTSLSWWVFAGGGAILIFIAMIVLCFRAFRSASANPVKGLRAE